MFKPREFIHEMNEVEMGMEFTFQPTPIMPSLCIDAIAVYYKYNWTIYTSSFKKKKYSNPVSV